MPSSVSLRAIVLSQMESTWFACAMVEVATYRLVGPQYFNFFALVMACVGVLFIFVAMLYKEKTHLRDETAAGAA